MSVSISVTTKGPLFENPNSHLRKAVEEALDLTSDFGKGILQDISPVRTGNLKAGWQSNREEFNSFLIKNDVPYTVYVDRRIQMVKRSQPQIEEFKTIALSEAIDKEFN